MYQTLDQINQIQNPYERLHYLRAWGYISDNEFWVKFRRLDKTLTIVKSQKTQPIKKNNAI
jgi:hypothetical protein